ncbi:MAG: hypothetical protein AB4426_05585 [Xenococcaceae cyanobacterium]
MKIWEEVQRLSDANEDQKISLDEWFEYNKNMMSTKEIYDDHIIITASLTLPQLKLVGFRSPSYPGNLPSFEGFQTLPPTAAISPLWLFRAIFRGGRGVVGIE